MGQTKRLLEEMDQVREDYLNSHPDISEDDVNLVQNKFKANGRHDPAAFAVEYEVPAFVGTPLFPFPLVSLSNGWLVAVAEVGPELATAMLELNSDDQRPKKTASVEAFSRDMANDNWKLTHQGVAFNLSGRLFDGQNRLHAVVKSGTTAPLLVFFGAGDRNEMLVLDSGTRRNAHDAATVVGLNSSSNAISTVRSIVAESPVMLRLTNTETVSLLEKHAAAVEWVHHHLPPAKGLAVAPVRGAIGRAYYHCDLDRLARFVSVYRLDTPAETAGDKNAVVLNKFIMNSDSASRASSSGYDIRAKAMRTILAFMNGETLSRIQPGEHHGSLYPVPASGRREDIGTV